MSVTIKADEFNYYDKTAGRYFGLTAVAEKRTSELLDEIEAKGEETIASIPSEYTELQNQVNGNTTDIGTIQNEIEYIENQEIIIPLDTFKRGGINSSGNFVQSVTYRVSISPAITLGKDVKASVASGFAGTLWTTSSGSNVSSSLDGAVIPADTEFRITIRRATEDTSETADIEEFASAVRFKTSDYDDEFDYLATQTYALPLSAFTRGGISSSGNPVQTTQYRVRTNSKFTMPQDTRVTVSDGFLGTLWKYPTGETAKSEQLNGAIIPKNVECRILIYRQVEDTSEIADVKEFASSLHYEKSNASYDYQNLQSFNLDTREYKNIEYNQLLFNGETVARQTARYIKKSTELRFKNYPYSIMYGSSLSGAYTEIRITVPNAFRLAGTQEIDMALYISDVSNLTLGDNGIHQIRLRTLASAFDKQVDHNAQSGWNHFRFYVEGGGNYKIDTDTVTMRIMVYHAVGTDITMAVGSIKQVKPDKGQVIIISDAAYYSFYTLAYPTFKQMGVPVTWALDATKFDAEDATDRHLMKLSELENLFYDGLSEFSFHSYDNTIMSTATKEQALRDTVNSIRFLKQHGLAPQHIWRAAWWQNSCADPSLANLEVEASASYTGNFGTFGWPPRDKYDLGRMGLANNRTSEDIDLWFRKLETMHSGALIYFHGISDATTDASVSLFQEFISRLETAINSGEVECTTFSRLMNHFEEIRND